MEKVKAYLHEQCVSSADSLAYSLHQKSRFGEVNEDKIQYSLSEALFLNKKGLLEVFVNNKKLTYSELLEKCKKIDKRILIKYSIFKDLREKGYIVKSALKFGADFRVYDKGSNLGEDHAKWIVFCEHESNKASWTEFAAKNRVAHSTKKNLLIGIVDEEGDVTYYEVSWVKP